MKILRRYYIYNNQYFLMNTYYIFIHKNYFTIQNNEYIEDLNKTRFYFNSIEDINKILLNDAFNYNELKDIKYMIEDVEE